MGGDVDTNALGNAVIDPVGHRQLAVLCADRIAARHPHLAGRQLAHDPAVRDELLLLLDAIGYRKETP